MLKKIAVEKVGHWIANGPQCSRCAVVVVVVRSLCSVATAANYKSLRSLCGRYTTLDHLGLNDLVATNMNWVNLQRSHSDS